jgi:hypothetical protein
VGRGPARPRLHRRWRSTAARPRMRLGRHSGLRPSALPVLAANDTGGLTYEEAAPRGRSLVGSICREVCAVKRAPHCTKMTSPCQTYPGRGVAAPGPMLVRLALSGVEGGNARGNLRGLRTEERRRSPLPSASGETGSVLRQSCAGRPFTPSIVMCWSPGLACRLTGPERAAQPVGASAICIGDPPSRVLMRWTRTSMIVVTMDGGHT